MNEPEEKNHWEELAAELGAEVKPPAEPKPSAAPSGIPPRERQKPRIHTSRPKPASNWDAVASDLGLAPAAPKSEMPESVESRVEARRQRADTGSDRGVAPSREHQTAEARPVASDEERDEAEGSHRKRRRRGRGRREEGRPRRGGETFRDERGKPGGVGQSPTDDLTQTPSEVLVNEMMLQAAADILGVNENPEGIDGVAGDELEPDGSDRPPRRRRRRRRKERNGRGPEEGRRRDEGRQRERISERPPAADAGAILDESDDYESEEEDMDLEHGEEEGEAIRTSHKGIPSWKETIDHIVSVNMAARAKNPRGNSGPPRRGGSGRSGRHRGRSSGG